MAKALGDAVSALHTIMTGISGLNDPSTTAPDSINTFPFVATMPADGEWTLNSAADVTGLHTLRTEIHVPWRLFPTSRDEVIDYGETVKNTIFSNLTLSSTVEHVNTIRYTFGLLGYGTLETYGYAFEIDVKIRNTTS